jgi:hypothetical protein
MRNAMGNLYHIIYSAKDYNLHAGGAGINFKIGSQVQKKMYENELWKFVSMIANCPVPWLRFKLSTSEIKEHWHCAIPFGKIIGF